MELIAQRREARRLKALREKAALQEERKTHGVDLEGVRFARMVEAERDGILRRRPTNLPRAFAHDRQPKVAVMVRKRPLNPKESALKAIDVVTCLDGGHMVVHEPKTSVDCTRRVESSAFSFDRAFGETSTNAEVYHEAVSPLVKLCLEGGGADATCFAYGQTGSGKTHTMTSCYADAAREIAAGASSAGYTVWVSFFDIYGGKCYDLLRERRVVQALEDAKGRVRVVGLRETRAEDARGVLALADAGASCRKTSRTDSNSASSRSHSIFQMTLRSKAREGEEAASAPAVARLSLVDLAGSERGADRGKTADSKTRLEGAEINKSLLALKECIRALSASAGGVNDTRVVDENDPPDASHVPFRGSKLTTVLRDAFVGKRSRTVLLAHISPGHGSADHTMNTLRYALRLKDGLESGPVAPARDGNDGEDDDRYGRRDERPHGEGEFENLSPDAAEDDGFITEPIGGTAIGDGERGKGGAGGGTDANSLPAAPTSSREDGWSPASGFARAGVRAPDIGRVHPAERRRERERERERERARKSAAASTSSASEDVRRRVGRRPSEGPAASAAAERRRREDPALAAAAAQEAYAEARRASAAAGRALVAAHLRLRDVVDEEKALLSIAVERRLADDLDANAETDAKSIESRTAALFDHAAVLEEVMAHRAEVERELRGNMLAVRRSRAEEEAAARDAQAAAWGDPWDASTREGRESR